ncbi:MAG: SPOR domain-containing protein [Bacteroidales bacterium]|nr:SPOR domain-containing protein [Bacteroidales bacterium]
MRPFIMLLLAAALLMPGCKFINEKILKKEGDTLITYVNTLENELELAERKHSDELRKIQQESQARMDSIVQYYENELASKGGKYGNIAKGTYYVVVGCFKTSKYAENYSAKINGMGYKSQIVKVGSWNFVAAESYTSWREALTGLNPVRESVTVNAWIYIAR